MLRILKDGLGTERLDDGPHLFGLMADDHHSFFGPQWSASAKHLFNQSAAARTVEHFG
jgi:hypothetical protein